MMRGTLTGEAGNLFWMLRVLDSRWLNRAGNAVFVVGAVQSGWRGIAGTSLNAVGVILLATGIVLIVASRVARSRQAASEETGHTSVGIIASDEAEVLTQGGSIRGYDRAIDARDKSRVDTTETEMAHD
jgi:hypothetical protein